MSRGQNGELLILTLHCQATDLDQGTAQFMAVDVAAGKYLVGDRAPTLPTIKPTTAIESQANTPFRYAFIHDLESIWWIAMWFLFVYTPKGTQPTPAQIDQATRLFSQGSTYSERYMFLTGGSNSWTNATQCLPPVIRSLLSPLEYIRFYLLECHQVVYSSGNPGLTVHLFEGETLHQIFQQCFQLIREDLKNGLCIQPIQRVDRDPEPQVANKRSRSGEVGRKPPGLRRSSRLARSHSAPDPSSARAVNIPSRTRLVDRDQEGSKRPRPGKGDKSRR